MKGFINIIKPSGMSSSYAVVACKKKFNSPCGHMGTLDPMASGVLPVGIGKTSRLFDYLLDKEKTYIAEFRFGALTDTLDITGKIEKENGFIPTEEEIKNAVKDFIGDIEQVPPKYSAKCIDGKRGYDLARKGVEFTLKPKIVHIDNIEYLGRTSETDFKFKIDCKGGTYIRSIARDLGIKTNSFCIMSSLIRSRCGIFTLDNGISIEELKSTNEIEKYIIPSDAPLSFDKIVLKKEQATRLLNGLYDDYDFNDGVYSVYSGKEFWGVGEVKDKKIKMRSYVRE